MEQEHTDYTGAGTNTDSTDTEVLYLGDAVEGGVDDTEVQGTTLPYSTIEGKTMGVVVEVQRPGVVVSGGDFDQVLLSQCEYESKNTRKSLSIHHLQRRLNELGFPDAINDKDGWFSELTLKSVQEFQRSKNLDVTSQMNEETLLAIFAGDPHIIVVV
jgi:peptidoglycan hydrolase-like protein with peptidoglycan-binding domain